MQQILRVFRSRNQRRAYYDKISKVYDLLADRTEALVRKAGLATLSPTSGEQVLEIGCGTGHCLVNLAHAVGASGRVYGVDLSEEMLRLSEKRLQKHGFTDRVELVCGDATSLSCTSTSLDAVFMSFTLELFSDKSTERCFKRIIFFARQNHSKCCILTLNHNLGILILLNTGENEKKIIVK